MTGEQAIRTCKVALPMNDPQTFSTETLITLTSDIVAAHVSNNEVAVKDVPALISAVFGALANAGETRIEDDPPEPAVSVRASVKKDHLVCLDCGKKVKMIKRHLMTEHGMTVDQYRKRWNLADDYPMVAPEYAERRRQLAVQIGLGRMPGQPRGRRKKTS